MSSFYSLVRRFGGCWLFLLFQGGFLLATAPTANPVQEAIREPSILGILKGQAHPCPEEEHGLAREQIAYTLLAKSGDLAPHLASPQLSQEAIILRLEGYPDLFNIPLLSPEENPNMLPSSVLCLAICARDKELTAWLLTQPLVDVNKPVEKGQTPLCLVLELLMHYKKHGQAAHWDEALELLKMLLAHQEIDLYQPNSSWTPLHIVVQILDPQVLELFIHHGGRLLNTMSVLLPQGLTPEPLYMMLDKIYAYRNHGEKAFMPQAKQALELFLEQPGIQVNIVGPQGLTPLHIAGLIGDPEIIAWLLSKPGIELNALAEDGATPFQMALKRLVFFKNQGWEELAEEARQGAYHFLAQEELLVNNTDAEGIAPLHSAVMSGELDLVEALLAKSDVDPNLPLKNGASPLYLSLDEAFSHKKAGRREAMRQAQELASYLLAQEGVDYNQQGPSQLTPLHIAVLIGDPNLVTELLSKEGIALNARSASGTTPLLLAIQIAVVLRFNTAARQPFMRIIDLLLGHEDIQPNIPDKAGATPLREALCLADEATLSLLLEQGDLGPSSTVTAVQTSTPLPFVKIGSYVTYTALEFAIKRHQELCQALEKEEQAFPDPFLGNSLEELREQEQAMQRIIDLLKAKQGKARP